MTSSGHLDQRLHDLVLRPLRTEDADDAKRLSALAFDSHHIDAAGVRRPGRAAAHARAWSRRTTRLVLEDGPGCWAVTRHGDLVGLTTSIRRETVWALVTFVVHPTLQGRGVGRLLLERASTHGSGALRWMLNSSADPRAARRYRLAGFDLHPQFEFTGIVNTSALAPTPRVRDGDEHDQEWMDSLDRLRRGAAHGDGDHALLRSMHRLRVVERHDRSGYAYVASDGTVELLAASDRSTATDLLTDAFRASPTGTEIRQQHVTGANQWALDVALSAGLAIGTHGYLGVRGMQPPGPYVHHSALL